ncbi:apolipoprotein N-acyltransferase [Opitutaceae bacterium TAV1]|nr:apolipoprotein N-acyltransferase [Opitutaceae bacterium TAV1]
MSGSPHTTGTATASPGFPDETGLGPPWWQRHSTPLAAASVFIVTVLLTILMFPPGRAPEAAYIFAAPALFWAYHSPRWKPWLAATLGSQVVAWTFVLGWLHNVTWLGLFLLGPVIGAWVGSWFALARWVMPRMPGRSTPVRLLAMFGLAGAWVVIEWTRTWLLGGFPWVPLAATQWERVSILQVAAWTGAGGVSFVLVAVNIGTAAYAHRLLREKARGLSRRSQEFMAALFLLVACLAAFIPEVINRGKRAVPLGRVAIVQPAIPQTLKWDPAEGPGILNVLREETLAAAATHPDVILWPEATTPWATRGEKPMQDWVEGLVREAGVPLVLGSIVIEHPQAENEQWFNGVLVVDPKNGLHEKFYAKRKLVPFGEYVPFRPLIGWIGKFVPVGDDFNHGSSPALLPVVLPGRTVQIGPLICYEDIFPNLARQSVLAGADVLVVNTNNGWFGEGGAAQQHASNSVLRAVEMRRPVLRAGNSGWSGWIDECGAIRAELTRTADGVVHAQARSRDTGRARSREGGGEPGTIYFRGHATIDVSVDSRWVGQPSVYVRWGDWFTGVCALMGALAWRTLRTPAATPGTSPASRWLRSRRDTPS